MSRKTKTKDKQLNKQRVPFFQLVQMYNTASLTKNIYLFYIMDKIHSRNDIFFKQ